MRNPLVAILAVALGACGPPVTTAILEVTVADHPDALSARSNDNLFILTFVTVPTPFAAADLQITAAMTGGSNFLLNFTHTDVNQDGNVDSGDTVTCREPGTGTGSGGLANIFDVPNVGQTINVDVTQKTGPSMVTQLARLKWVATN